ncbi:MAG: adenylate/guanylate cyclase domain-containing protein [Defluviitaleaceae bacterium]|nr:adenylate/guanylate cyclase domain-containing protein [Defluviitaleaceae bacterium]
MKSKKYIYAALLSAVMLLTFGLHLFDRVEQQLKDRLFTQPDIIYPNIFVFGIDEETLIEFGPFQFWPRSIMAEAIRILNSEPGWEPAVIAVDVLYSGYSNCPESDAALVEAAAEVGNVVFGAAASFNWADEVIAFERPFESLRAVSRYGTLNAITDHGVVRRAVTGIMVDGIWQPSFTAVIYDMYAEFWGRSPFALPKNITSPMFINYAGNVGDFYGAMGLGTSFRDIFSPDFDPAWYADSIIFIGPYAAGMMDMYFTPVSTSEKMNGVEIHANVLQMMIDRTFKAYAADWVNWMVLIISLLVTGFVFMRFDVRITTAVLVVYTVGYVFLNLQLFNNGYIVTLLYPPASVIVLYVFGVAYNYITERREKAKIKDMFKKYVDPKLVDQMIDSSDMADGRIGRKKHFAVMFVDVRGFTPMSEKLADSPETIVHILNDYLELTASCVFNNGGSVDKFIGDATMALFNGFTPLDDYVYKAVKAAQDIVDGAAALNEKILAEHGFTVGFGVGVHCGYAVVGNIGPHFRKDYTAIGDTVNTAARLESNAKPSQVLISKEVYETLEGRISAQSLGEITMKGKGAIEIFELT